MDEHAQIRTSGKPIAREKKSSSDTVIVTSAFSHFSCLTRLGSDERSTVQDFVMESLLRLNKKTPSDVMRLTHSLIPLTSGAIESLLERAV